MLFADIADTDSRALAIDDYVTEDSLCQKDTFRMMSQYAIA